MKKCFLMITDAGNGHRSCAESLRTEMIQAYPDYDIEIINPYKVIFKSKMEDFYNKSIVGNHLFFLTPLLIRFLNFLFTLTHFFIVWKIKRFFVKNRPDLVISLMPYINNVYRKALNKVDQSIPFCVVLTDWSDDHKMWVSRTPNQIFFCNTLDAQDIIKKCGHPNEHIHLLSGMILKKEFYDESPINIPIEREKLGLYQSKMTVLMMYGLGSILETIDFLKSMNTLKDKVQFIVLCGNNQILKEKIENEALDVKIKTIGFTKYPAIYFKISDLFVGKPGPGSLSEALHLKLPIITELNSNTVAQERFNAIYVEKSGYGIVVNSFSKCLKPSIEKCIDSDYLKGLKATISAKNNRGVYEIIEAIAPLMK